MREGEEHGREEYGGRRPLMIISVIAVSLIVIIASSVYFSQTSALKNIDITGQEISNVKYKGAYRFDIEVALTFDNPSKVNVKVSRVEYQVLFDDRDIGKGEKEGFQIEPGKTTHIFLLDADGAAGAAAIIFSDGSVDMTVKGVAVVVAEFMGADTGDRELEFETTTTYKIV